MSDPKNKWNQPAAPPPPMFFGEKERNLVKQVNDELAERVIGQPIAYYPISLEESNFNETYGESQEKVSLPPVRVYAYVVVDNEQTNEKFGYEYQTKLTVNFHRRRLVEDQNLFVRVGDFVQYGDQYYEIVRTYNDTRYLFGQVEHKFQIAAECVRARHGVFRVMPSVDRAGVEAEQQDEPSSAPAPRPAPYPPLTATYVTVKKESKLPNERVLTAGTGITIVDGGPNGPVTINSAGQNAQGPTGSLQLQAGAGSFNGVAELTFLTASNSLGIGTDAPTHELTVVGGVSASADSFFAGDVTVEGTLIGGSPLKVHTAISIVNDVGEVCAVLGSSSLGADVLSSSLGILANLTASENITATHYYGSGRYLTDITASAVSVADGPIGSLQFKQDAAGEISGSSGLLFATASNELTVQGNITSSANISASYFYGDGRYMVGITASAVEVADGPVGSLQFRYDLPVSGELSGSANVLYDYTNRNLTVDAGLVHARTAVSSSHTASVSEYILAVTAVPTSIELDAAAFSEGQVLVVKDESGLASPVDTITLSPSGAQTVDGDVAAHIESPYGSVLVYSNGTNWFIY